MKSPVKCTHDVLCRLSRIVGHDVDYEIATRELRRHSQLGRVLFFSKCISDPACVYGHATFKYETTDAHPMKLCCSREGFLAAGILDNLIVSHRVQAVLSNDVQLLRVLSQNSRLAEGRPMFHLANGKCTETCGGEERTALARLRGLF